MSQDETQKTRFYSGKMERSREMENSMIQAGLDEVKRRKEVEKQKRELLKRIAEGEKKKLATRLEDQAAQKHHEKSEYNAFVKKNIQNDEMRIKNYKQVKNSTQSTHFDQTPDVSSISFGSFIFLCLHFPFHVDIPFFLCLHSHFHSLLSFLLITF